MPNIRLTDSVLRMRNGRRSRQSKKRIKRNLLIKLIKACSKKLH